ncbi:MAG TPA: hypothetical protein VIG04_08040, partial [Gemmatimonadales bacterium]
MNQVTIDRVESDVLLIRLAGRWELRDGLPSAALVETELRREPRPSSIAFETPQLDRWDSSILAFLAWVSQVSRERGLAVDTRALPVGLQNLLGLAEAVPEPAGARRELKAPGFLEHVGAGAVSAVGGIEETLSFVGRMTLASLRLIRMK